jgi:GH3 auxin-responsive promoter
VPTWTAVVMQRVLEVTGKQNILEVWPNFELFIHGGVNFEPYREQFKAFLPSSQVKYLETYNASEGFFGIQYQADRSELVLLTHLGIFFEFYPATEVPSIHNIVPLSAVKPGINYAVIISTVGGLWRYIIGDTIQFHGLNPFTFKITGRTKLFINAFGEELVIENAETAIAMACKELDAIVTDYTAAPVYLDQNENPGHEWLIEFAKPPADLKAFTELLDRELQRTNDDYKGKRAGDMLMKMPQVIAVPTLTFHDWLKSKGKLGGQNKVPRLSNDRKIIEEIKGMIGL